MGLAVSLLVIGRLGMISQQQMLEAGEKTLAALSIKECEKGETLVGSEEVTFLRRSLLPMLWVALSFVPWGVIFLYLTWAYLGFSMGIVFWLVISVQGWRGPFVVWALLFPQYLCYLPAMLLLHIGCLQWYEFRREYVIPVKMAVSVPAFRLYLARIVLGILLYGAGTWIEIRWNPWFYEKIFTIS